MDRAVERMVQRDYMDSNGEGLDKREHTFSHPRGH